VLAMELERYLHEHIPLSKAMALAVVSAGEGSVVLRAPLAPNINHSETVFGGSAAALAILAAWSLTYLRLRAAGIAARLVIQRNAVEYLKPMAGEFIARAALAEADAWQRFTQTLKRRGRARLAVTAVLEYAGEVSGRFSGEFVAFAEALPQR
jgi:thioesterase domain-containing protein